MFLVNINSTIDDRIPAGYWIGMVVSHKAGVAGQLAMHRGSAIGVSFGSSRCQNKLPVGWLDLLGTVTTTTIVTRIVATMEIPMTGSKCRAMFPTMKTIKTKLKTAASHVCFAAFNGEGEADRQRYRASMPPRSAGVGTIGTIPLRTRLRFT